MFDIPGFNPKGMSDEELLNRQIEISRRLVWASRFSGSMEMVAQLQAMSAAIDVERRERIFHQLWAIRDAQFPAVIETEPDLKPVPEKEPRRVSDSPVRIVPSGKPRSIGLAPKVTRRPVKDDDQ